MNEAARYYKACVRREAESPEGWYGSAAVALARGQSEEAANALVKAWMLDRRFPVVRMLRDVCPDDPDSWYALAGALVAMRRKSAYQCADLALAAVMADPVASHALRQRAARVRHNIASALEARAVSDMRSENEVGTSPLARAILHSLGIVLGVAVLAGAAFWVNGGRATPHPAPAVPTSAGAAPADSSGTPEGRATPEGRGALDGRASSLSSSPEATGSGLVSPAPTEEAFGGGQSPSPASLGAGQVDAALYVTDDHGNGHEVKLDGEVVGKTPITLIVRPEVPATITVSVSGRPWKVRVKPVPGQTKHIEARL